MNIKWFSLGMVILMLLVPLLTACSPQGPQQVIVTYTVLETIMVEGTPQVVERIVEVTPTPMPPAPVEDPTIIVIQGVDPASLDPHVGESGPKINVLIHMFDTLFDVADDMEIVPSIVESWEVLNDNLTWKFKLKEGIKFWNGQPLDANAVKFTIDRTMDQDLIAKGLNDPFVSRVQLESVEVQDEYTVVIHTKTPQPLMGLRLTYLFIMEPTHYQSISFEDASINPMGSGAFKFVSWTRDDNVTMERNPDWWGGQSQIGKLIFRSVPEASVRLSELETGNADLVTDVIPEDMARVSLMPHAHISWVEGGRRIFVGFDTTKEHFQDPRVRQAFNYAINWSEISEGLLGGMGNKRLISVPAAWTPVGLEAYPYDPEKAKSLLEEAGFPMDKKLILNTPIARYLKDVEIAQVVAAQLNEIGLNVEVVPLEWSVMSNNISQRTVEDLFLLGLGSRFNGLQDLDSLRPDATFNAGSWVNQDYLDARLKANSFMDIENQKVWVAEAALAGYYDPPWIFLYNQISLYGVSNRLLGWQARPDERINLSAFEFRQ